MAKNNEQKEQNTLEQGTYEIIQNRLANHQADLRKRIDQLNNLRTEVFGGVETKLINTDRITTDNKCVARDMIAIGNQFIFGYNVHMGLRSEMRLSDVFSCYEFKDQGFHGQGLDLINSNQFTADFLELYKYYKDTQFTKFKQIGPFVYMVFQIGKADSDIKAFKWQLSGDKLTYIDNRSDHEVVYPNQHEFDWIRATRDMYRDGDHPHVSINDRVFVETVGGDLTIKVEDNTDDGMGIYNEPVDHQDQNLDDAEILYAIVENLVFLKVKPYKEQQFRYLIFNSKLNEVVRVDDIANACVLLPDDQGVVFSSGYYLQTGEYKLFELDNGVMKYQTTIVAPNGEDYLYVFNNQAAGVYTLLSYNVINQRVLTPTICHGFSLFANGQMCVFRAEEEPQNHHTVQIWQTPFDEESLQKELDTTSVLAKIGNKEVVKAMAECNEVINLLSKQDSYANLYVDLVKKTQDVADSYHWLHLEETHQLNVPLLAIKDAAALAIDEFEKVQSIKKATAEEQHVFQTAFNALMSDVKSANNAHIDEYVKLIARLREARGKVVSLYDLRYADEALLKKLEAELAAQNEKVSQQCVSFLLQENSLQFYNDKINELNQQVDEVQKVVVVEEIQELVSVTSGELEMLIEVVSNLKIKDATQTTQIINTISDIYAQFNQLSATIKRKRKSLMLTEGEAVFHSQIKLISQGVVNYLDVADTVDKCDAYLTKLLIQLEELEAKFSEFDEYVEKIAEKRDEIYGAFESRKVYLADELNKKTARLQTAAERILKGVSSRLLALPSVDEINGFLAADLMVDKLRSIVTNLTELGDTVKADDIQSQLKSAKEEAVRQLRDKTELFTQEGTIKFGRHQFSVNTQKLDLSIVPKSSHMFYHIAGTNFFEQVVHSDFEATKPVWNQSLPSENSEVYRAEYLAWIAYQKLIEPPYNVKVASTWTQDQLLQFISDIVAQRYEDGYVKGVHDVDAMHILNTLLQMAVNGGVLTFGAQERSCAIYFWTFGLLAEEQQQVNHQIKAVGSIVNAFPNTHVFDDLIHQLAQKVVAFQETHQLFLTINAERVARYLFAEFAVNNQFSVSAKAVAFCDEFYAYLNSNEILRDYKKSVENLALPKAKLSVIKSWLKAFAETQSQTNLDLVMESAMILTAHLTGHVTAVDTELVKEVSALSGTHTLIKDQNLTVDYRDFTSRLMHFQNHTLALYQQYNGLKNSLVEDYKKELKLNELTPRVMSSFVRNKLINEVYLPLIGDNLAKQIGAAGEGKRTDLMGMLLLISPPGYGKTTLMEYIASRLGLIFLKINGPSLGHTTTSLDPESAPNAGAREEIEKLNLGFEMGDNVMIYLDDIQHCHPEFLQKFISLSDGQRKIEGVYKGESKTYDLRGKKVAVVMAGNPYTESGDKFKIPDMLANRADIYNLGDIIGDSAEAFKMSYIENCLTSNPTLAKLAGKSQSDLYTLIKIAETGSREGAEFESNHSANEVNDYVAVLKTLFKVRDVVLKVNAAYIKSAATEDQYRVEPSFKLQGSYRNMNKIAEKINPIMNADEVDALLLNAYVSESQTLTSSAEANLLKFKEMLGWLTSQEQTRWEEIKSKFMRQQKLSGFGGGNQMSMILSQIESVSSGLLGIKEELAKK